MGVAAYNRGSSVIRATAEESESSRAVFDLIQSLNCIPHDPDSQKPFAPMTISFDSRGFWAIEDARGFGYWYKSLRQIFKRWRIEVTGYDAIKKVFFAIPKKEVKE